MLRITILVDAPAGQAVGIKEDCAQYLEQFGDARVLRVEELLPQQLTLKKGGLLNELELYGSAAAESL